MNYIGPVVGLFLIYLLTYGDPANFYLIAEIAHQGLSEYAGTE